MILIISNEYDFTTTLVIEWLENLNKKWIRINGNDIVDISFLGKEIVLKPEKGKEIKLSEISGFWYRRGFLNIKPNFKTQKEPFLSLQKLEIEKITEYIYHLLNKKKSINNPLKTDVNKLIVSSLARGLAILTPNDYIISEKKAFLDLKKKCNYITKTVSGEGLFDFNDFTILTYSSILNPKKIYKDSFFPSLLQNYIDKKYELRVFYFKGKTYSMAIFSQEDNNTKVDFRNYNKEKPNRTVPYLLPLEIEEKIITLMNLLDLDCGSLDIIVTPDDRYIFLEVNPIGQFGMVSYPCNYKLEKIIAEYL